MPYYESTIKRAQVRVRREIDCNAHKIAHSIFEIHIKYRGFGIAGYGSGRHRVSAINSLTIVLEDRAGALSFRTGSNPGMRILESSRIYAFTESLPFSAAGRGQARQPVRSGRQKSWKIWIRPCCLNPVR